jgi:cell division protein FtsB
MQEAGTVDGHGHPRVPRRVQRIAWVVAAAVAAVVIAGAPARQWWAQRGEIERAETDLEQITEDNAALQARLDRMKDPAEVERVARAELGMVREGEESYSVLPPATAGLVLPDAWPFNRLAPVLVDDPVEDP